MLGHNELVMRYVNHMTVNIGMFKIVFPHDFHTTTIKAVYSTSFNFLDGPNQSLHLLKDISNFNSVYISYIHDRRCRIDFSH